MEKDNLIYEKEMTFLNAFNDAIEHIKYAAENGEPLLLKEVIQFGFNNVMLKGKKGYEESDFTTKELNTLVEYDDWDYDLDGYRIVYLKPYSKSAL